MSRPDSTSAKCGYHKTSMEYPCKRPAGDRTDHHGWGYCWMHSGNTPNGIKHAARLKVGAELAERKAAMFYGVGDVLPHVDPEEVLLHEVRRSYAIVRWLEEMIGSWDLTGASPELGDVVSGLNLPRLGTVVYFDKGGTVTDTEAHAWIKMFREERREARLAAKMAIDAGVQERLVQLAERQTDALVGALRGWAEEAQIELTPERLRMLGRHLRAIDGGVAAIG